MAQQRRAGITQAQLDGEILDVKGAIDYSLGGVKRDAIIGADGRLHGFKETVIPAYVEFKITDRSDLDLKKLAARVDSTVTIGLANGKTCKLGHAWYAAELKANTEEGEVDVRFECDPANAEEI